MSITKVRHGAQMSKRLTDLIAWRVLTGLESVDEALRRFGLLGWRFSIARDRADVALVCEMGDCS